MGKKKQARSKLRKASKQAVQGPSSESIDNTPRRNMDAKENTVPIAAPAWAPAPRGTALVSAETSVAPEPVNAPRLDNEEKKESDSSVNAEIFKSDSDDLEGLLQYMYTKKHVDCFCLAEFMPYAASILEQNDDDDELRNSFMDWINGLLADKCYELPEVDNGFWRMCYSVDANLWNFFAEKALAFQPNYRELLSGDDIEAFQEAFDKTWEEYVDDAFDEGYSLEALQLVIDKTCENWGRVFDEKLCDGVPGCFLLQCPIYDKTVGAIRRLISKDQSAVDSYVNTLWYLLRRLSDAVYDLVAGVPFVHSSCWECGKDAPGPKFKGHTCTVPTCSGCDTAIYCSVSCQKKAWNNGHKLACANLKDKYKLLLGSFQAVDERIESGLELAVGIRDYDLLAGALLFDPPFQEEANGIVGPSTTCFYNNFAQIRSGQFWFVYEPQSMEGYMACLEEYTEEENHFEKMVATLSYDCLSLLQNGGTLGFVRDAFKEEGCKMPRERFLDLCEYSDHCFLAFFDDEDVVYTAYKPKKMHRVAKKRILCQFREKYHKKNERKED